jgi:hypothetical protein
MSYGLYIGRNHTADGIAYLAGYGDEPSSHWLEIVPPQRHAEGATITVGVAPQAEMPGLLTKIPHAASGALSHDLVDPQTMAIVYRSGNTLRHARYRMNTFERIFDGGVADQPAGAAGR